MNRKLTIPIIFMFFLSLLVSSQAQPEYTNGRMWSGYSPVLPPNSIPHDPKIACDPILEVCGSVWFDDFYNWVTLSRSSNNFQSKTLSDTVVRAEDYTAEVRGWYDYYHLPYDIIYDSVNGTFKIIVFDSPSITQKYTYAVGSGTLTNIGTTVSCIGFSDSETLMCAKSRQLNNVTGYHLFVDIGFVDWQTNVMTIVDSWLEVYAGGENYNCQRINHIKGWADQTEDVMRYRMTYEYEFGSAGDCSFSSTITRTRANMSTFGGLSDGIFYWDGNFLYYRWYNQSNPAVSGIYRTETTDLTTFGTGNIYYTFDDTIEENISSADYDQTLDQIWVYEKWTNDTVTEVSGLWSYDRSLYDLQFSPSVQDVDMGAETVLMNYTITLTCSAENYTQIETVTDGIADLSTPCLTGNNITVVTADASPVSFTFDYNVLSGCEEEYRTFIYNPTWEGYVKNYNLTITARDSLLNDPIPGMDLTLNGITETTDANGNAFFEVLPISNPNFNIDSDASSCLYRLSINGSEKFYNLIGTGTGYDIYIESNIILADYPFSLGAGDFTKQKTIYMDMTGARAEVHIYSSDGIEVFPSVIEIEVIGANHTYLNYLGEITETNISYVTPALFYLIDDRTSYPANFTLRYFYGDGCDTYDYYEQNATILQDSFQEINFYLNENSANLKCCYPSDCPENFCMGKYYKEFSSCSGGTCQYSTETCISSERCDPVRGCFDQEYAQSCVFDSECEDFCLNNYSMIDKLCGSDGFCLGNIKECETNCSATEGVCSELLPCMYPGTHKFRLVLPNQEENTFFQAVRRDIQCDFDNIGETFCISQNIELLDSQGWIGSTDNIDRVVALPENWRFKRNDADNGWVFYAISITCDNLCGLSYEYCENGCNTESGACIGEITGEQQGYSEWIANGYAWVLAQIPLPYRMLAWIVLTIIIMWQYRSGIKGHQGGDKDTLLVGFAMFLGGTSLGWIHWIFLLIVGVIITFVLWEKSGLNK